MKEKFQYIYEVYTMAISQLYLLQKKLADYDEQSKYKETEIVIISSLTDAIIANVAKITVSSNQITIGSLINEYNVFQKSIVGKQVNARKPKAEIERIREYRNEVTVHSSVDALAVDFKQNKKLLISDIEAVLSYTREALLIMGVSINGYAMDIKDVKTGETRNNILEKVKLQVAIQKSEKERCQMMSEFLKDNHADVLCSIIAQTDPKYKQ